MPPTAKVMWKRDMGFIVSSDRLEKPGVDAATPANVGPKAMVKYYLSVKL